jgi:hypothetical protein
MRTRHERRKTRWYPTTQTNIHSLAHIVLRHGQIHVIIIAIGEARGATASKVISVHRAWLSCFFNKPYVVNCFFCSTEKKKHDPERNQNRRGCLWIFFWRAMNGSFVWGESRQKNFSIVCRYSRFSYIMLTIRNNNNNKCVVELFLCFFLFLSIPTLIPPNEGPVKNKPASFPIIISTFQSTSPPIRFGGGGAQRATPS